MVAARIKQRVAMLLFRGFLSSKGSTSSDVGQTQRISCWVTVGVQQMVEAGGGLLDQDQHAVGVLGVTFECSMGWAGPKAGR